MKKNYFSLYPFSKTKLLLFTFLFLSSIVFAQNNEEKKENFKRQSVISPASAFYESSTGSISWTLGNTISSLETFDNDSLLPDIEDIDFNITAYPNPTIEKLNISHNSEELENLTVSIYDLYGRELIRKQLDNEEIEIHLKNLPSALYVVSIRNSRGQMVKTFKIIKH